MERLISCDSPSTASALFWDPQDHFLELRVLSRANPPNTANYPTTFIAPNVLILGLSDQQLGFKKESVKCVIFYFF